MLEGALRVVINLIWRETICLLLGKHRPETKTVMQEGNLDGVWHKTNELKLN